MRVAIIYTSMSGNTKDFAELIHDALKDDYDVKVQRLEAHNDQSEWFLPNEYDALILGTYTWGKGELPIIQKDYAYYIHQKPPHVYVFGTGDTQFGEENYCSGAVKLGKYYNSPLRVAKVEQTPRDSQLQPALDWIEELKDELNKIKGEF